MSQDGQRGVEPSLSSGPVDATTVPRYAGFSTFARLPRLEDVRRADIVIAGVPFDSGVSFRPGARFGPSAVREASRLLRTYNPALDIEPFSSCQIADAGDVACNPFDIAEALGQIERSATELQGKGADLVVIGGDHTVALPMLRSMANRYGPVALVHFDAHLDTWDSYFGAAFTHGTPFRRASEEGLLDRDALVHVGIRGPVYTRGDLVDDGGMGFEIISAADVLLRGVQRVAKAVRERVGDRPLYLSIDIDVLDPAFAPGTGTPEAGGLSSRELLEILRSLAPCNLVGADVVEVAPAYDHAQITALAAAHLVYELSCLLALKRAKKPTT